MLSIPKILLLAVVIGVVWYGWRWLQQGPAPDNKRRMGRTARRGSLKDPQDMEKCRVCGTYVATGSSGCGRANCPYR